MDYHNQFKWYRTAFTYYLKVTVCQWYYHRFIGNDIQKSTWCDGQVHITAAPGDTVTIRDLSGTVSKIKIRATTIVDWDRKEIIVPNKAFITEQLVNWSLSDPITRVIVTVNVARDSDPNKVEILLRQVVSECEFALKIPEPDVWFAGFGSHTLNFEVRTYAKDMDARWPLRHSLHKQVVQKLKDNDVELAYPQMDLHINQQPSENKSFFIKP